MSGEVWVGEDAEVHRLLARPAADTRNPLAPAQANLHCKQPLTSPLEHVTQKQSQHTQKQGTHRAPLTGLKHASQMHQQHAQKQATRYPLPMNQSNSPAPAQTP